MLVLFESPAGYAVFKVLKESKLKEVDNIWQHFQTPEKASQIVQLQCFEKFKDATDALSATASALEFKVPKRLKKVLKQISSEAHEELGVVDAKLGNIIKEKHGVNCVTSSAITELYRNIKSQANHLIGGISEREYAAIQLGLAHGLSRYKLKFNPDKIDTMIIQAVNLLDDLDKELNNYGMRMKEWYGWHFPELSKIVADIVTYAKTVKKMGTRDNATSCDFSEILTEDVEKDVKSAADVSMGTEISKEDIENVSLLCDQIIDMYGYRSQLAEYLTNRMMAVAPNLTVLVGELLGARLIAHAGSLLNLAKHPASTVQVFGAEKALFRAIAKKQSTPKFGLMYHATLVNQASNKYKGKISRMLAAKSAIAIRVDALKEDVDGNLGVELRSKVEKRLRQLETGITFKLSGRARDMDTVPKYKPDERAPKTYDDGNDFSLESRAGKRKFDQTKTPAKGGAQGGEDEVKDEPGVEEEPSAVVKSPKGKKAKKRLIEEVKEEVETVEQQEGVEGTADVAVEEQPVTEKKKKKKKSLVPVAATEIETKIEQAAEEVQQETTTTPKKKKKRQSSAMEETTATAEVEEPQTEVATTTGENGGSAKKKKRKSKSLGGQVATEDDS
ncbi:nucleolar protein 58-like isoform X2 [Convolutriloba macropyga]|uniref:nucleolar protein 58-like isoform X2 n=1 Tax=Convolutriloba macropyga TaxID=536237 RepID=UPI003F5241D5